MKGRGELTADVGSSAAPPGTQSGVKFFQRRARHRQINQWLDLIGFFQAVESFHQVVRQRRAEASAKDPENGVPLPFPEDATVHAGFFHFLTPDDAAYFLAGKQ